MKLYEISDRFQFAFDMLEKVAENPDEYPADAVDSLMKGFDGMNMKFDEKAESIALHVKELKAQAMAIKDEEKRLAGRRKAKESQIEWFMSYLLTCMQKAQKSKLETSRCVVSIRSNPESVEIDNTDAFVEMLCKTDRDELLKYSEPEIRKAELKKRMQDGETFEGARLVRKQSLNIK